MICDPKTFATTQARAALAGITLSALQNDTGRTVFIASRWALTREFPDLKAVCAWLEEFADHPEMVT
jgi:hypothetical protein